MGSAVETGWEGTTGSKIRAWLGKPLGRSLQETFFVNKHTKTKKNGWNLDGQPNFHALQMKCRRESNINVWFPFMYSQKWNCALCSAASIFPKQNYNVLSPNSYTHKSVRDLYIPGSVCLFLLQPNMWTDPRYINRSQTHDCGNWEWGRAIPRKRNKKMGFSLQCNNIAAEPFWNTTHH